MRIIIHFSRILMNTKTTITLAPAAIAASLLLFASGPLVGSQQALAQWNGGWNGQSLLDVFPQVSTSLF